MQPMSLLIVTGALFVGSHFALSHPLRSHAPTLHDVLAFVGAGDRASTAAQTAARPARSQAPAG